MTSSGLRAWHIMTRISIEWGFGSKHLEKIADAPTRCHRLVASNYEKKATDSGGIPMIGSLRYIAPQHVYSKLVAYLVTGG